MHHFYCLVCHLTVTESDLFDDDRQISEPEQRSLTHDSLTLHLNDGLTDVPQKPWQQLFGLSIGVPLIQLP